MAKKSLKTPLALAASAALLGSLATTTVVASENPFAMEKLSTGYKVAGGKEGKCGEGKCGEGKCGGKKGKKADAKKADAKKDAKKKEGKCGEGKCGGNK